MAYDAVPLIPRSVLFGNPTYALPSLSPDGRWLGYVAPRDGVLNVWVAPADDPAAARPVTDDRGQGIRMFGFCHDDRTLYYLHDDDGDENWRLHLLDLTTDTDRCVTPFSQVQVQVLAHERWHPTTMMLALNRDNPQLHDVYRLDLTDDSLTKVEENPGYAGYVLDTDLTVRMAVAMTADGGTEYFLRQRPDDEFDSWLTVGPEDALTTNAIAFARDNRTLYLASSIGANSGRLLAVDVVTGEQQVLAEDPRYDVSGVEVDPHTGRAQAAVFHKDRHEWVIIDPEFGADLAALRRVLDTDDELTIDRSERGDQQWVVTVTPSDGPLRYYRYDRTTGEARFLFSHRPELDDYTLAPMHPFAYTARDGLTVQGYVTYPPGVPPRDLPAVLNVHGGPWHRDSWGYHPEAQWLANRGYACVQVNFRGSTGYGKEHLNAGAKEWGRAMHHDLLDAVAHLADQGIVDRSRVGIMGGSYGGYAALVGAAFTPGDFRCAIDLCGPANLLTLLESIPPYWQPLVRMFHTRVGDPDTERDMLVARSPLTAVRDIRVPVLVAQGANDPRVKQAEAEQIVAALRENDIAHEYLLFDDEGHGLARPANRERYYAAAERFLASHLGGRHEQAASDDR